MFASISTARLSLALLAVSGFSAGVWLAVAFASASIVVPHKQQSASVAESLNAEKFFGTVDVLATAGIVVDIDTGAMLFQKNPDAQLPLASLTKVPLMLAVSEVLPSNSILTIPRDTVPTGATDVLRSGSAWHASDLMAYTLVGSSNDGAEILARAADEGLRARYPNAPEKHAAVWRMNDIAHSLGLTRTYFLNPSGLDESTTQSGAYGSARDMATLFSYAANQPGNIFVGTARLSVTITSQEGTRATASNTDEALDSIEGIEMGKTGFTDLAGGNLAVVFDANGKRFVAVVLGSTQAGRFSDMRQLVAATERTAGNVRTEQ